MPAVPEAMAHGHLGSDQTRRDRVRVALEGDERRRTDGVVVLDRRRVARSRQGPKPLELGQVAHARTPASACGEERDGGLFADELFELGDGPGPAVADAFAEPVELALGVVDVRGRHSAPEALGGEVDGLLHAALAVAPPRRTGDDARPVVLGHGDEARLDDPGLGVDDGRHAVDAPAPGVATEAPQHAVHRFDQMGLVFGFGEDAPELARARQRADQQMGVAAPGGLGQLVPVPLDLFAGRVLDLDGGPALHARHTPRSAGAAARGRRPRVKLW